MEKRELEITAQLAYLDLPDAEAAELGEAVQQMLQYFETMNALDVGDLPPTTHALLSENRLRADATQPSKGDALLDCAPEVEDRLIVIPNVL